MWGQGVVLDLLQYIYDDGLHGRALKLDWVLLSVFTELLSVGKWVVTLLVYVSSSEQLAPIDRCIK